MPQHNQQLSRRESYDEVEYQTGIIKQTHPCQLGGIASLFGVSAPEVTRARILEIGCGLAQNLLPIAASLPQSICVGVDLSARQIEQAQRNATALKLDNVVLIAADVRALVGEVGNFDYIICHGVYSWVPDEVREELFSVCRRLLSPSGLLYMSYNTYPGWADFNLMRELYRRLFPQQTWSRDKTEQIDQWIRALPEGATRHRYEKLWFGHFRGLPNFYKYHGIFSEVNHPVYFEQAIQHARESDFTYVSDVTLQVDVPSLKLRDLADQSAHRSRLEQLQMLDFAQHTSFRSSLFRLTSTQEISEERVNAAKLDDFQLTSLSRLSVLPLLMEVTDLTQEQRENALARYPNVDPTHPIKYYQKLHDTNDELIPIPPSLARDLIDAAGESWPQPLSLKTYFTNFRTRQPDDVQELLSQCIKSVIYEDIELLIDALELERAPLPIDSEDFCPRITEYNAHYLKQQALHLIVTPIHRYPHAAKADPWFSFIDLWDGTRHRAAILESVLDHTQFEGSKLSQSTPEERAELLDVSLRLFRRVGLI